MDNIRRTVGRGAGDPSGGEMSQQALDLRKSMQILRRRKLLVAVMVLLAILGGVAYAVVEPPTLSSTALVALSAPAASQQQQTTTTGIDPFTATQEVVAGSYQVLAYALAHVRPAMSLDDLRRHVQVSSPSTDIISITANGSNTADVEATANAVANSYIHYVASPQSVVGHLRAQLLESANLATGPSRLERFVIFGLLGGLGGALIGVIVALAVGRNDRRLRARDEIANSVGIPVLASVPVAHPSSAGAWTKLLEDYKPTAVHSWQLRTALQQLGLARLGFGRSAYDDGRVSVYNGADGGRFSLVVLSLSSDPAAMALGPQLAAFAASQEIPTSLVIGPQQDAAATATLRTACAAQLSETSMRHGLLRVTSYNEGSIDVQPDTALVIVVAVVDSRAPKMPETMRTNATVMGVSAGAATAEQLARAAVVAASDGREITGILVADPDPDDQTTGRIPQMNRPARRVRPSRLRGIVTEIRR
jgi:capsular polysaccharide biosynthesis protein